DVHVHDTYFVIAHFHYVMVGGMVMAYLGGLHFWWPKLTGRMYPEGWAKLAALITFIGFNLTFFPQFLLGYMGMPRRYAAYPAEFQVLNVLSTAGASILAVGFILPLIYLLWSMRYGPVAGPNPWRATGLEWETSSPPPTHNFEQTPVVTEIMMFGGLFTAYLIYRLKYYDAFVAGSTSISVSWGFANTLVLIASSLTMAMAVWAAQKGIRRLQVSFIVFTMLLGATFLGVKAKEYYGKDG